MEIRLHVILLIVCSALFTWCWRLRRLNSPATLILAVFVAFLVARLLSLAWATHAADLLR